MAKIFCRLIFIILLPFVISCGEDAVPSVSIVAPQNGAVYLEMDTITFVANITHDINIESLNTNIEPIFAMGALDVSQLEDRQNIEFAADIPIFLPLGAYTFVLSATDIEGNTGTDAFSFVVE